MLFVIEAEGDGDGAAGLDGLFGGDENGFHLRVGGGREEGESEGEEERDAGEHGHEVSCDPVRCKSVRVYSAGLEGRCPVTSARGAGKGFRGWRCGRSSG